MTQTDDVYTAARHLTAGGVVAYPTESAFGLGCDPGNEVAVRTLLDIKNRPISKGFILIGSNLDQVLDWLEPIEPRSLARVMASWPGPVTWVFPCKEQVPYYVRGDHQTLAVRMTGHPIAKALCEAFKGPIISTSANFDGQIPATNARTVRLLFGDRIDVLLDGALGGRLNATPIFNAVTGEVVRQG